MFIKNTIKKDVKLRSFEGYKFVIPPGVLWIWDPAGEHLLKIYFPNGQQGKWGFQGDQRVFIPQSQILPPIIAATEKEWIKEGKRLSQVERFRVNYEQIPKREQLIGIAKKRGVPDAKITEWLADEGIDRAIIAEAINELPVPDEVRFPKEPDLAVNDESKQ